MSLIKEAVEVQEGRVIDITLTEVVDVGDVLCFENGMVAIANLDGLVGDTITATTEGVWEIEATTADEIKFGQTVYFNQTTRKITITSTDNCKAGKAMTAKAAGTAGKVAVKINV